MASADAREGRFFWHELRTADPERAEAFYRALFGWEFLASNTGSSVPYRLIALDGEPRGGITTLGGSYGSPEGAYSRWTSYTLTGDIDAAIARAVELGGTHVSDPHDVPDTGRYAELTDPQGATILTMSITYPAPDPTADIPVGGATWNELVTNDIGSSTAFYRALFGYELFEVPSAGGSYILLQRDSASLAGIFQAPGALLSPAWMVYFRVANIETARSQVETLGGTNLSGIIEIPGFGRTTWSADPTDARFGLHEVSIADT